VDHKSFSLDIKIIALTIWRVLKHEGINQPGHATMKEFKKNNRIFDESKTKNIL